MKLPFEFDIVGGPVIPRRRPEPLYVSSRVFRHLWRLRPDAVMVGGYSVPALYASAYCQIRGAALILFSEGTPASEGSLNVHQRLARLVVTRAARAAVGPSAAAVARFGQLGFPGDCTFLAPYALDLEERPYRSFDNGESPKLLFVGQLVPRKGVSQLLHALASLDVPKLHLTVAGSGPDRPDLEAMTSALGLEGRVRFIGFVDQTELPGLYASHDLFVFPTLRDTFGVVTLEAMAAGLPVVASTCAGSTSDFIAEGTNGWRCDPVPCSIAAALKKALSHRSAWPAIGHENREAVRRASPDASAGQIVAATTVALSARA